MEYLLDMRWADPVAAAVARVLSALPGGVEQTTAAVPVPTSHGFMVLRADHTVGLEQVVQAITAAGANVRVVVKEAA
jgi:hypothetical protein